VKDWLFYDIVRFKIELGVEEKFMCKNAQKRNKTNATWQYAHAANSYGQAVILLRHSIYSGIRTHTPSRVESYSARLVLNGDNMLGLCDPSNFLLFEYSFYPPRSDALFSYYFEDLLHDL